MEKENDFKNEREVLNISDIIKKKLVLKDTTVELVKKDDGGEYVGFRPRTMSDPLSGKYYRQARNHRYPQSHGCNSDCCEHGEKHTHFSNSKQIAQSIYPDFLSSIPSETDPAELKKIIKKLLTDSEQRKGEASVDLASDGPSKKSLLAWYRREYGLSFDESKANIT